MNCTFGEGTMSTTYVEDEIASQPESWRKAAAVASELTNQLPQPGERVAVVGCGTSWFIGMSYAAVREQAGHGVTDAFAGSEYPDARSYDKIVAISRSGTTTEIIDLLARHSSEASVVITAVPGSPVTTLAHSSIEVPFADEKSVVQTRFATSALVLLRAGLGEDVTALPLQAERALVVPIRDYLDAEQVTFLGRGAGVGLAQEAALKTREAAQFWAESYPAMDYRHGPIAIAEPGRLVWSLGESPEGLREEVLQTGATFIQHPFDALAGLIVAQRFAVELARSRNLDPDNPRSLTRSVILAS